MLYLKILFSLKAQSPYCPSPTTYIMFVLRPWPSWGVSFSQLNKMDSPLENPFLFSLNHFFHLCLPDTYFPTSKCFSMSALTLLVLRYSLGTSRALFRWLKQDSLKSWVIFSLKAGTQADKDSWESSRAAAEMERCVLSLYSSSGLKRVYNKPNQIKLLELKYLIQRS